MSENPNPAPAGGNPNPNPNPNPAPAPFDLTPALATLSPDNKGVFEKKGWLKDGKLAIDLNGIGDSYRGVEKLVGAKTMVEPVFDTDENFDKWDGHSKMGVPADAKSYKFDRTQIQLPQGVEWDQATEDKFRDWAFKAKVPQIAFQRLMKEAIADRIAGITQAGTAIAAANTEADTKLRGKWGAGYDAHLARSKEAFGYVADQLKDTLAPEQIAEGLEKLGGSAFTLALFDWLGEKLGEDVIKGGNNAGFASSKSGAQGQLAQLENNPDFVKSLQDRNHPNHKANVETRNRLMRIVHGA